jgi:hypothetical protein
MIDRCAGWENGETKAWSCLCSSRFSSLDERERTTRLTERVVADAVGPQASHGLPRSGVLYLPARRSGLR